MKNRDFDSILTAGKIDTLLIRNGMLKMYSRQAVPIDCYSDSKVTLTADAHYRVDVKRLKKVLSIIKDDEFSLIIASGICTVSDSDFTFTCKKTEKDLEYIQPDTYDHVGNVREDFKNLLPYASVDETRYFMTGIFVDHESLVATDGRRMIVSDKVKTEFTGIVNPVICAIGAKFEHEFSIGNNNSKLAIQDWTFYSPNISGQFPNWKKAMPEKQEFQFFVESTKVLPELEKIKKVTESKTKKAIFKPGRHMLTLVTAETEEIQYKKSVSLTWDYGLLKAEDAGNMQAYFDVDHLVNLFRQVTGKVLTISYTAVNKAFTFKCDQYDIVIMPMKKD